jgi:troponin I
MADEDRALTEDEKKARKRADRERKRVEAREAAEKKKRFGLTPEKKRKLRLLIMKMATENLKGEQQRRLEARKHYIDQHIKPLDDLHSMSDAQLKSFCQDLHKQLQTHEETRYDFEIKIRKQDYDINELTIKINDIKGKFVKPSLKKVSKTEQKLNKIKKPKEEEPNFINMANLKQSTNKFALKEEVKEDDKINFRDQVQLKSAKEHKEEEA